MISKNMKYVIPLTLIFTLFAGCATIQLGGGLSNEAANSTPGVPREVISPEIRRLLESARQQTQVTKNYSQQYFVIGYPNGDVPADTGACSDVIIRSFRAAGVDLQKEVHEDMRKNFSQYPSKRGLKSTDTNIDHRRVPNLRTFFTRRGKSLPVTADAADYYPGDIVTWDLNGKGMTHIGIVSGQKDESTGRPFIYHNIGGGTQLEDRLFEWKITGRYRYF